MLGLVLPLLRCSAVPSWPWLLAGGDSIPPIALSVLDASDALLVELLEAVDEVGGTGRPESLWLALRLGIADLIGSVSTTAAPAKVLLLDVPVAAVFSTGLVGFLSLVLFLTLGVGSGLTGPFCGGVSRMSLADCTVRDCLPFLSLVAAAFSSSGRQDIVSLSVGIKTLHNIFAATAHGTSGGGGVGALGC